MRAVLLAASVLVAIPATALARPTPVTVYLRRDGGTLTAGWDDSRADVSSLAWQGDGGESVTIPKWRGGDRKWKRVAACVRARFAAFAIDIVEKRPAAGDYIMVMVGGRSDLLGYGDPVAGVSPYTGEVVSRAVSFVFPENIRNDVEGTCTSILHEVGHTLGLDHAYLCEDPMSYLFGCGKKTWQDADAECGVDEPRDCGNGAATQNSYRQLAAAVGLRGDPQHEPEVEPDDEEPVDPYDADGSGPTVDLSEGALELAGDTRVFTITATASAPAGVADVALLWAHGDRSLVLPCGDLPADVPATCRRDGDRFTFRIEVGTGTRGVAAAAIDADGAYTVTEPRWLRLED